MKTEIKAFGRTNKDGGPSISNRCGKLTMTAMHEVDAALLALLGRMFSGVGLKEKEGARYRLYCFLLEQATDFQEPNVRFDDSKTNV